MLKPYSLLLDKLQMLERWFSSITMLVIVLINIVNLFRRWLSGTTFGWILEVSLILFIYSVLIYIPAIYRNNGLINMGLIEELLDKRTLQYINFVTEVIILAFAVYLLTQSIWLTELLTHVLSRGLGIRRAYIALSMPISATLLSLVSAERLLLKGQALISNKGGSMKQFKPEFEHINKKEE